mgnify:CR=1 FL=1
MNTTSMLPGNNYPVTNTPITTNSPKNQRTITILLILIAIALIASGSYYYFYPRIILGKAITATSKMRALHFEEVVSETKTNGEISKASGDIIFPNSIRVNPILGIKDSETVVVDDKVYVRWIDKWSLIEGKKPEEFAFYNPQKFIALLSFVSKVKSVGTEKIGDQKMRHLGYAIDEEEARKVFSQTENNSYKGEVWIGESDGLIHRIAIIFTPERKDIAPTKYQMDFYDFNGDIKIEKPKITAS